MVTDKQYTIEEKEQFQKACSGDVKLHYNFQKDAYEFLYKPQGADTSKLIGTIPRARALRWRRPNTIMNHACRHALFSNKLPTKVKVQGAWVEVHTS